ncbi:hypothetical protein LUX34_19575 [Streptomyces werraensis]|nr:hypothetical protein [Streptomyces werraensis]
MSSLTITWTPHHHGWALVKVVDDHGEAEAIASYVTDAPEQFLYAVARLVLGDENTQAELEGEPQVYRWFFHRDRVVVDVRLVLADDARAPDSSGTVLWSGRHTVMALARSVVRAFDRIDYEQGEESYEAQWGGRSPGSSLKPCEPRCGRIREPLRPRAVPPKAPDERKSGLYLCRRRPLDSGR